MVRTGATFRDAGEEWLRHIEQERGRKPATIADYRSALKAHLNPAFGELPLEQITTETIFYFSLLTSTARVADRPDAVTWPALGASLPQGVASRAGRG
jgi:hypothetical protein